MNIHNHMLTNNYANTFNPAALKIRINKEQRRYIFKEILVYFLPKAFKPDLNIFSSSTPSELDDKISSYRFFIALVDNSKTTKLEYWRAPV